MFCLRKTRKKISLIVCLVIFRGVSVKTLIISENSLIASDAEFGVLKRWPPDIDAWLL